MKKLPSVLSALLFALVLGAAMLPATAAAADENGEEAKVEVVEFFWYGCPHCYRFQNPLHDWLASKPDFIEFRRVPALLTDSWEIHARAFYAAELLGELERFHQPFFDALHADGRNLNTVESIAGFAGEQGIDAERFAGTMESFAVESRLRTARNLNRDYSVRGTPSVGVAGEHTVSPRDVSSFTEMMEVVERHARDARDG
jgi:protein dithiol oxidoreductase (disulfide-forming)